MKFHLYFLLFLENINHVGIDDKCGELISIIFKFDRNVLWGVAVGKTHDDPSKSVCTRIINTCDLSRYNHDAVS